MNFERSSSPSSPASCTFEMNFPTITSSYEDSSSNSATSVDLDRVLSILCSAEDTIASTSPPSQQSFSETSAFLDMLEPTPIGPNGITKLITSIPSSSLCALQSCNGMTMPLAAPGRVQKAQGEPQHTVPDFASSTKRQCENAAKDQQGNLASAQTSRKRQCRGLDDTTTVMQFCNLQKEPTFSSGSNSMSSPASTSIHNFASYSEECYSTANVNNRYRQYQADQWDDRFKELQDFKQFYGHCMVPHNYTVNPQLAQWVKRQRYQHKLKGAGRHSTLSDSRQQALINMGFVWDSHRAAWLERFQALCQYKKQHGHCNVPSNDPDRSLAIWVKCQRRQYKLFRRNKKSTMNDERISQLDSVGFDWNPRNL